MSKRHVVKLTADERAELGEIVRKKKAAAWKIQRAQALLKCDQGPGGPDWPDARIAEAFGCATRSLESWRKQAVEAGLLSLLERKPQAIRATALDGEQEAQVTMPPHCPSFAKGSPCPHIAFSHRKCENLADYSILRAAFFT